MRQAKCAFGKLQMDFGVQKIPTLKLLYIHVVDCDVIVPCITLLVLPQYTHTGPANIDTGN